MCNDCSSLQSHALLLLTFSSVAAMSFFFSFLFTFFFPSALLSSGHSYSCCALSLSYMVVALSEIQAGASPEDAVITCVLFEATVSFSQSTKEFVASAIRLMNPIVRKRKRRKKKKNLVPRLFRETAGGAA